MASYRPDVKFIASIYPGPMPVIQRAYGITPHDTGKGASRSTTFRLEPVPRGGKPFVLEVYDSFESIIDVMGLQGNTARAGEKPRIPKPVPVETIVADLLNIWTGGLFNVPNGAAPGIIEIVNSAPTQAEIAKMNKMQTLYFSFLFNEAEKIFRGDKTALGAWTDIIPNMRLAADWLGEKRVWSDPEAIRNLEPCPVCKSLIQKEVYRCPSCQTVLRALPAELAKLQPSA